MTKIEWTGNDRAGGVVGTDPQMFLPRFTAQPSQVHNVQRYLVIIIYNRRVNCGSRQMPMHFYKMFK